MPEDEITQEIYLGDGAYVKQMNHEVKLWTSEGYGETNVIWLNTEMVEFLSKWIK